MFRAPMGAGKTSFVKGVLRGLGFDEDEVTSPSFSLVNRYESEPMVYHLDLWRLEEGGAFAVGLEELLEDETAVTIIEWAENLSDSDITRPYMEVRLEIKGENEREIVIQPVG